ncbi:MAG: DUF3857 domain-containing protein [Bacteroidales bacterium]
MRTATLVFLLCLSTLRLVAQEPLDAELIPDSLLRGSDAVIRFSDTRFERTRLDAYTEHVHYAVTVLHKSGRSAAGLRIFYDRNSKILDARGTLYDKHGEVLSRIGAKDMEDESAYSSYTLFSDTRVKSAGPVHQEYPYTVEYEYSIRHQAVVSYANWIPQRGFDIAVQEAGLELRTPEDLGFSAKVLNHEFEQEETREGSMRIHAWRARGLKPVSTASSRPHEFDFMPAVLLSPTEISYEGTTGSYRSWEDYGRWTYSLIRDRMDLPPETVSRVRVLTEGVSDPRERARILYAYMQQRTRYVNVVLGLGGFQPLPASEVDEKGYGDCKALSNYMRALLASVGIPSYYAEIGNGDQRQLKYPDFVSANQTNHIILCVPFERDTVWLECTSQTAPFGYFGQGNAGRYALLIKESGGELVRTPSFDSETNLRLTRAEFALDESGNASCGSKTVFSGLEYETASRLLSLSPREQREALLRYISVDGLELTEVEVGSGRGEVPDARIAIRGDVHRFAKTAGSRMFLGPEFLFSRTEFSPLETDRSLPLYRATGFRHVDSLTLSLPPGYHVVALPEEKETESPLGQYSLRYEQEGDKLRIYRDLRLFPGSFDPARFPEINDFHRLVTTGDRQKIVLQKNEI